MESVKTILASLTKLDDVAGVMVSRGGKALYSSFPEVYSADVQENLQHLVEEISNTFAGAGSNDPPQEIVSLYENGTLVVREAKEFHIFVILRTVSPSPLVSVALNALALRLEKTSLPRREKNEEELIPLVLFNEVVKLLTKHYGPAAKLMVKRALKQAGASEKGLPLSHVSSLLKFLKQEIDDPKLAQMAINKTKDLVRLRRNT